MLDFHGQNCLIKNVQPFTTKLVVFRLKQCYYSYERKDALYERKGEKWKFRV